MLNVSYLHVCEHSAKCTQHVFHRRPDPCSGQFSPETCPNRGMALIVSLVVSFYLTWLLFRYYMIRKYRLRWCDDKKIKHFSTVEAKREADLYENALVDTVELSDGSESISKIDESAREDKVPISIIDQIQKESDITSDARTEIPTTDQANAIADEQRESSSQTATTSYAPGFTFSLTFSGEIRMGLLQSTMAHVDSNVNTEPQTLNISSQPNSENPMGTTSVSSQIPGFSTSGTLSSVQIETFPSAAQSIAQNLATAMRTALASASASLMTTSEITGQSSASILVSGAQAGLKEPLATPDQNPARMFESSGQKCTSTPEPGTVFNITSISNNSAADDNIIPKKFLFNDSKQEDLGFGQTTPAISKSTFSFPPHLAKKQLTPEFHSFTQVCNSEQNKTAPSAFSFDYPGPSSGGKKTTRAFHYCFPFPTSEGNKTLPAFSFGVPAASKTMPVFSFGSSAPGSKGKKIMRPPVPSLKQNNRTPPASIFVTSFPTSKETQKHNNKIQPSTPLTPIALAISEKTITAMPESISSKSYLSLGGTKSQQKFNCFDPPLSGVISPTETKVPITTGGQIVPGSATPAGEIASKTTNSNSLNTSNFKTQSFTLRKAQTESKGISNRENFRRLANAVRKTRAHPVTVKNE